jgi:hypothetical protein
MLGSGDLGASDQVAVTGNIASCLRWRRRAVWRREGPLCEALQTENARVEDYRCDPERRLATVN